MEKPNYFCITKPIWYPDERENTVSMWQMEKFIISLHSICSIELLSPFISPSVCLHMGHWGKGIVMSWSFCFFLLCYGYILPIEASRKFTVQPSSLGRIV